MSGGWFIGWTVFVAVWAFIGGMAVMVHAYESGKMEVER